MLSAELWEVQSPLMVAALAAWGAARFPLPKQQNQENVAQDILVICIIDAKQHPTVQILSLQSGNLHPHPVSLLSHFPSC